MEHAGPVPGEPGRITIDDDGNLLFENISISLEAQTRLNERVRGAYYTHCNFTGRQNLAEREEVWPPPLKYDPSAFGRGWIY